MASVPPVDAPISTTVPAPVLYLLCFVVSEYLLWTAGCFWPDTSPASPIFWCDMLLTLAILGLLPATRKAVEA